MYQLVMLSKIHNPDGLGDMIYIYMKTGFFLDHFRVQDSSALLAGFLIYENWGFWIISVLKISQPLWQGF